MATDYEAISKENRERYGTDIGRIGPMLLADRYDDRTHFIFELLQNAEDALGRRENRQSRCGVKFELTPARLVLSHHGRPFDEADVRGICGIAESTKDQFSIGRFGIGFKSVYTFTDHPEIHSGDEDFIVENYVSPKRTDRAVRAKGETQIILPLKASDVTAQLEITHGFQRLGPSALLFLRHINDISWEVAGAASGVYVRSDAKSLDTHVQQITVLGQESGKPDFEQDWLVFRREVASRDNAKIGRVEVAFLLQGGKEQPANWSVLPVTVSPLVVYFPTVVETNLGFLLQGPYRTTPSRDNIPRGDTWNQHLVKETASLVIEAMRWIRDNAKLDTSALRSLPLVREKFQQGAAFTPIFDAVRRAFLEEPLLPRLDGGYVAATEAKLARTQELRELLSSEQLAALFEVNSCAWLIGDITSDREPELRAYLMRELGIPEVTPQMFLARLNCQFLEAQSDEWTLRFYEFLAGQEAALRTRLNLIPLIRLSDGTHVVAREGDKPNAFLPGAIETEFPTMRREVCATAVVRAFLISLGITEPDPVDDVVWNVLPKYRQDQVSVDESEYTADMDRIRAAFETDSKAQREKLLSALRKTNFVMVIDTGDGTAYVAKPGDAYMATDRFKQLFAGVPEVLIVDDDYECLRGEKMRELLAECGALRYPRPVEAPKALTSDELRELRRQTGQEFTSGVNDRVGDRELEGFEELISLLPKLNREQRTERARLIWESLSDLEERRGRSVFDGSYSWSYYGERKTPPFPAAFVRRLNKAAWVPDENGELVPPSLVVFETLGWKANPFLLTKIAFKPPILDQLAKEAGIEPGAIDLLRRLGITSVAQLTSMLGIEDSSETEELSQPMTASDLGVARIEPKQTNDDADGASTLAGTPEQSESIGAPSFPPTGSGGAQPHTGAFGTGAIHSGALPYSDQGGSAFGRIGGERLGRTSHSYGARHFVSYVAVDVDQEEADPDGLDRAARMHIEEQAIQLIIESEPRLQRAPVGNPGFDLFESDASEKTPTRWVEVKSMTGNLDERPVTLSSFQFEYARQRGSAFWLYVVEHATETAKARILRIQDPVAQARTFTFDRGWKQIARTEPI